MILRMFRCDLDELLNGEFPNDESYDASHFSVVTEGPQSRISNHNISRCFCRYDSAVGAYIPNKGLQFLYPLDTSHLMSSSQLTQQIPPFELECVKEKNMHRSAEISDKNSTTFSSAHLDALDVHLKAYHVSSGREVFDTLQEKLFDASTEVIQIIDSLLIDVDAVLDKWGLSQDTGISTMEKDDEQSVMKSVFDDIFPILKDLRDLIYPQDLEPNDLHSTNINHHVVENHFKDVKESNFHYLRELRHQAYEMWDDNSEFPLSLQRRKQRRATRSIHMLLSLGAAIEQPLMLRFQNLNGRISEFESRLKGGSNCDLSLLPSMVDPPVKFRLGQVLRHK